MTARRGGMSGYGAAAAGAFAIAAAAAVTMVFGPDAEPDAYGVTRFSQRDVFFGVIIFLALVTGFGAVLAASAKNGLKGRHVLFALIGFFVVIFATNFGFISLATQSFPGVEVHEAYTRGQAYNDLLAERAEQARRGWTAALEPLYAEGALELRLAITDRDGAPVPNLVVEGELRRPATDAFDHVFVFDPDGDGYIAHMDGVGVGEWEFVARAHFADGAPFEANAEFWFR